MMGSALDQMSSMRRRMGWTPGTRTFNPIRTVVEDDPAEASQAPRRTEKRFFPDQIRVAEGVELPHGVERSFAFGLVGDISAVRRLRVPRVADLHQATTTA
jgi:hypothetical protein